MTKKHLTREQVEQRLRDQESKIAGRIESIESNVPGKSIARISRISADKKLKIGAFIGVGMVVGLFFALRRKSSKPIDLDDGLDRLSSRISDAIREELDSGENPDDAVRKALDKTPPILNLQKKDKSMFGEAFGIFSRLVTKELARSGSKRLLHHLGLREDGKEEADADDSGKAASGISG